MEQLIVKALKSACGNRHFKFQVIIDKDRLHIYVNYRPDYFPNQLILEETVGEAIASLNLETIEATWLYGRPLSQVEPAWQVLLALPTRVNGEIENADGNGDNDDSFLSGSRLEQLRLEGKDLFPPEIDAMPSEIAGEIEFDELSELSELTDFIDFEALNSAGDTGLLHDTGLVHGGLLKEAEINTFTTPPETNSAESGAKSIEPSPNSLVQYCFVTNKKFLTDTAPNPDKNTMRMVKFVHHLSSSDRHQLLPILDRYFRGGITPGLEETLPAIQNWFKQIKALEEDKQRTLFIWLSRYCFDPATTLEEFQTISAQNEAEMNQKTAKSSTEYSFVNVKQDVPSFAPIDDELVNEPKSGLSSLIEKIWLPGLWSLATIISIVLGIVVHNSNMVVATAQIPDLCQNSSGSPEYCRLAVNLAGEKAITQANTNLFPMTEVTETVADYGCARYTNRKAGVDINQITPEATPLIASRGEKIFPHIYVVQTEQQGTNIDRIKVGCVYTTGQGQRSPKLLAADLIPLDWPESYYQKQSGVDSPSFGIFTNPINLGLYTIFAALGIVIALWLNLGLAVNHTYTVYLVALMLGIVQLGVALIPSLGLLEAIFLPIVTIIAASFLVKDFRLNLSRGYPSVAISVLIIVGVQVFFYSLYLGLIGSLI
ncbi:MAG: hypothetical protein AAFQ41_03400 [Cyanobacteria bacterium J06623_7]